MLEQIEKFCDQRGDPILWTVSKLKLRLAGPLAIAGME